MGCASATPATLSRQWGCNPKVGHCAVEGLPRMRKILQRQRHHGGRAPAFRGPRQRLSIELFIVMIEARKMAEDGSISVGEHTCRLGLLERVLSISVRIALVDLVCLKGVLALGILALEQRLQSEELSEDASRCPHVHSKGVVPVRSTHLVSAADS